MWSLVNDIAHKSCELNIIIYNKRELDYCLLYFGERIVLSESVWGWKYPGFFRVIVLLSHLPLDKLCTWVASVYVVSHIANDMLLTTVVELYTTTRVRQGPILTSLQRHWCVVK